MKELGVTTLELMPVTEFNEVREETEIRMVKLPVDNQPSKFNYWGYGDSFLFAPKASYSSGRRKHPDTELKTLVRELQWIGKVWMTLLVKKLAKKPEMWEKKCLKKNWDWKRLVR